MLERLWNNNHPIWHSGFRPFFLAASLAASVNALVWILNFNGIVTPTSLLAPSVWHAHDMIFGFSAAVMAGFLLTAVANWTGKPGIQGGPLKWLVLLWLVARIGTAVSIPIIFWCGALADILFYPLLAVYFVPYFKKSDLGAEYVFFLFFLLQTAANATAYTDLLGYTEGWARPGLVLAIDSTVAIVGFMGGRVIPFFTESSIARRQPKVWPLMEWLSAISIVLFVMLRLLALNSNALFVVGIVAGIIHGIRLWGWHVRRVRRVPLIWILHVGYAWLVLGLFLSAGAARGVFPLTTTLHAFTMGALGIVIFGMITRVALGHTGRRLHPALLTVVGYGAISIATFIRVVGPLLVPAVSVQFINLAAVLWIIAFIIYIIKYYQILTTERFR